MIQHTVESDKITINAPQWFVWQILLDLPNYPDWNPFTYQVISTLKSGDPVDLYVDMPNRGKRMQRETIQAVESPGYIAWGMEMFAPWALKALRTQHIEALPGARCLYYSDDHFKGILTPLVTAIFGRSIKQGFDSVGHALKQRAEMLWQQQEQCGGNYEPRATHTETGRYPSHPAIEGALSTWL